MKLTLNCCLQQLQEDRSMKNKSISRIWKMMQMQFKTLGKSFFAYPLICAMGVCFMSWLFNMDEPWPILLKDVFHFTFMISIAVPLIMTVVFTGVLGQQNMILPASNLEKYIALLLSCLVFTISVVFLTLLISVPVMILVGWIGYKDSFSLASEVWNGVISGFGVAYFVMTCCGMFGLGLVLHRSKSHRFAYISSFFLAMFLPGIVKLVTGIGKPVLEPYATVYFPILGLVCSIYSYQNFRRIQLKATDTKVGHIDS